MPIIECLNDVHLVCECFSLSIFVPVAPLQQVRDAMRINRDFGGGDDNDSFVGGAASEVGDSASVAGDALLRVRAQQVREIRPCM
jgi:hypothetical protein